MKKSIVLTVLFLNLIWAYSQKQTKIPKEAYRLSMSSYQEIYGKTPESVELIKFFGKKRQKALLYTSIGSGLALPYFVFGNSPMNIITMPALVASVPVFGIGVGLKLQYNRKRLYRYLIQETPIPNKISKNSIHIN